MRRPLVALTLAALLVLPQSTNTAGVSASWPVGHRPFGVAVDSTDGRLYVAKSGGTTVSVVDPATGTVQSGALGTGRR